MSQEHPIADDANLRLSLLAWLKRKLLGEGQGAEASPSRTEPEREYLWEGIVNVLGEAPNQVIGVRARDYRDAYEKLEALHGQGTVRHVRQKEMTVEERMLLHRALEAEFRNRQERRSRRFS